MENSSFDTNAMPKFLGGHVWLAGAGPGDPGLITLLCAHALQRADVVVYDALVGPGILEMARPEAELKYAGKRGGKPSPKQPDITLSLIEYAREGKRVLRLKGGDPFVFGRGGEEAMRLAEAGIPFRIVPGVTAGVGGLAYAGIPLTHRDHNPAVTFLTGHGASGKVPENINWRAIAEGSPVIVMYMALKHLPNITEKLLAAGRDPDEPVALISRATLPEQTVLETRLSRCVADAAAAGIEPPAVVVIGSVVSFREHLDWLKPRTEGGC
jgi:uroporphyrin-III C-methyltransferase